MSVRNRNAYANRRSTSSGLSAVRSVLVFLVLAMLSFALGFFVLARLMPDNRLPQQDENASLATNAANMDDAHASHRPPAPSSPAPRATSKSATAVAPVKRANPAPDDGPVIEADSPDAAQTPADPDAKNTKDKGPSRSARRDGTDTSDDPTHAAAVQTPRQPDGTPAANGDTTDPNKPKRYFIQINLHTTREAAEQEAQEILDRGIKTRVKRVTRGGRTYYSVQYRATFHDKQTADTTCQKLIEQGISSAFVTEL